MQAYWTWLIMKSKSSLSLTVFRYPIYNLLFIKHDIVFMHNKSTRSLDVYTSMTTFV